LVFFDAIEGDYNKDEFYFLVAGLEADVESVRFKESCMGCGRKAEMAFVFVTWRSFLDSSTKGRLFDAITSWEPSNKTYSISLSLYSLLLPLYLS